MSKTDPTDTGYAWDEVRPYEPEPEPQFMAEKDAEERQRDEEEDEFLSADEEEGLVDRTPI